jgi:hypothetical protein
VIVRRLLGCFLFDAQIKKTFNQKTQECEHIPNKRSFLHFLFFNIPCIFFFKYIILLTFVIYLNTLNIIVIFFIYIFFFIFFLYFNIFQIQKVPRKKSKTHKQKIRSLSRTQQHIVNHTGAQTPSPLAPAHGPSASPATGGASCPRSVLTSGRVPGVGGQAQGGAAVVALEAAAVEEQPLRAETLHHVHPLAAEEAHAAGPRRHSRCPRRRLQGAAVENCRKKKKNCRGLPACYRPTG